MSSPPTINLNIKKKSKLKTKDQLKAKKNLDHKQQASDYDEDNDASAAYYQPRRKSKSTKSTAPTTNSKHNDIRDLKQLKTEADSNIEHHHPVKLATKEPDKKLVEKSKQKVSSSQNNDNNPHKVKCPKSGSLLKKEKKRYEDIVIDGFTINAFKTWEDLQEELNERISANIKKNNNQQYEGNNMPNTSNNSISSLAIDYETNYSNQCNQSTNNATSLLQPNAPSSSNACGSRNNTRMTQSPEANVSRQSSIDGLEQRLHRDKQYQQICNRTESGMPPASESKVRRDDRNHYQQLPSSSDSRRSKNDDHRHRRDDDSSQHRHRDHNHNHNHNHHPHPHAKSRMQTKDIPAESPIHKEANFVHQKYPESTNLNYQQEHYHHNNHNNNHHRRAEDQIRLHHNKSSAFDTSRPSVAGQSSTPNDSYPRRRSPTPPPQQPPQQPPPSQTAHQYFQHYQQLYQQMHNPTHHHQLHQQPPPLPHHQDPYLQFMRPPLTHPQLQPPPPLPTAPPSLMAQSPYMSPYTITDTIISRQTSIIPPPIMPPMPGGFDPLTAGRYCRHPHLGAFEHPNMAPPTFSQHQHPAGGYTPSPTERSFMEFARSYANASNSMSSSYASFINQSAVPKSATGAASSSLYGHFDRMVMDSHHRAAMMRGGYGAMAGGFPGFAGRPPASSWRFPDW